MEPIRGQHYWRAQVRQHWNRDRETDGRRPGRSAEVVGGFGEHGEIAGRFAGPAKIVRRTHHFPDFR